MAVSFINLDPNNQMPNVDPTNARIISLSCHTLIVLTGLNYESLSRHGDMAWDLSLA